ncbi:MAG TPA: hypothetical protein VEH80_04720 [Candidatus Bathyarchaeia archaeon]|nr:hypothetical protein [Candidatus Bathyarchaeia archaeon]
MEKLTDRRVPRYRAPSEVTAMHSEPWYDLAIRELSELSDPAKEKLAEAAAAALPDLEAEAEPTKPAPRAAESRPDDRRSS